MKRFIKYTILLCTVLLIGPGLSQAQQVPMFSQYMFNKFILNPAVAGSEGYTAYNLTSREQWVGFKDAPMTNALSAQTRLIKNKFVLRLSNKRLRYVAPTYGNVGIGVHVFDDRRGLLNQTGMQFTYAYHEKVELKAQLSFGITLSLTQFRVSHDRMILYQPDGYLNSDKLAVFIPDFNVGMYYTTEHMYLGFAVSQLMESAIRFGTFSENQFKLERNYNMMGGYRFLLTPDVSMEPSFQIKTTEQFFAQLDIGCRWYYRKDFWGGVAYRTGGALIATLGVRYNNLYFGYAYDFTLNQLQTYSAGSHELIISLKFGENIRKYKWIERY
jgi:type IX secretion system PorP/SprF family membrane protein